MVPQHIDYHSDPDEGDLWFLPGPIDDGPPAKPPRETDEHAILDDWRRAEAGQAARLAHVAMRLGALDERLRRGPAGWRHRLALIEAADLSWFSGARIAPDRLALWLALRLAGVQGDAAALARAGWAVRRLSGGPGPLADLAAFLDRRDPENPHDETEPLAYRAGGWTGVMERAGALHPISRACMGYHLWPLAGLGARGVEAAVTAARIAAGAGRGAGFAPLAMGGGAAGKLRAIGPPGERLAGFLAAMEAAILSATRQLDDIEAWSTRAEAAMAPLSGRTPPALRAALAAWPLLSAPMAEALTGASRAAVQRNLAWMQARGLIREVTGQGRFRLWCVT